MAAMAARMACDDHPTEQNEAVIQATTKGKARQGAYLYLPEGQGEREFGTRQHQGLPWKIRSIICNIVLIFFLLISHFLWRSGISTRKW